MKSLIISSSLLLSLSLISCGSGNKEGNADSAKDTTVVAHQEEVAANPRALTEQQRANLLKRAQNAQATNNFKKLKEEDYADMIVEYESIIAPLYQSRTSHVGDEVTMLMFYQNEEINDILNEAITFEYVLNYAAGSSLFSDALIQRWNEVSMKNADTLAKMRQEKERLEAEQARKDSLAAIADSISDIPFVETVEE